MLAFLTQVSTLPYNEREVTLDADALDGFIFILLACESTLEQAEKEATSE